MHGCKFPRWIGFLSVALAFILGLSAGILHIIRRPPEIVVVYRSGWIQDIRIPQDCILCEDASVEPFTNTGYAQEIHHVPSGTTFVFIPAGQFLMGSDGDEIGHESDEEPKHRVTITHPFYLAKHEVTMGQWQSQYGEGDHREMSVPQSDASKSEDESAIPLEVHWDEAWDFCQRYRLRLPSEAEWEYACRAGTTSSYCFGDDQDDLSDYAWYGEDSSVPPHQVCSKTPNAWGLFDMHGNVAEWCFDSYASDYSTSRGDGRAVTDHGISPRLCFVIRGGARHSCATSCRSASRGCEYRWSGAGFRPAFTVEQ